MMRGLGYQSHHFAPGTSGATLNFNFLNDGLDPRITFTRASNATQFNSAGTLVYAPHNLILDSEDWSTASWNRLNCTFSYNAATAPNGTLTADRLIPNNGSTIGRTTQFVSTLPDLVSCVLSVYVKTSGLTNVIIQVVDKSNTTQSSQTLNLSTGTLSGSIDAGTTSTATDTGDGWYRFNFAITSISSGATTPVWTIRCSSTGNGTDGILLWGAQLNVGSLQSYNQTTSTAYYGPRLDYNPATLAAQGLLIEEQRTNLYTYSQQIQNTIGLWTVVRGSTIANEINGLDGTLSASKLQEDTTVSSSHYIYQAGTSYTSGTTYTQSVYVKAAGRTQIQMSFPSTAFTTEQRVLYDLTAVTATTQSGTPTSSITSVGNGWYRCVITAAATATIAANTILVYLYNGSLSYTGDGTSGVYLWGAQLEAGAFPTSYIPTTTTALTRSADVASVNTLSPWYNSVSGTLYAEAQHYAPSAAVQQWQAQLASGSGDYYGIYKESSPANITTRVRSGGVDQAFAYTTGAISANTTYKTALGYAVNDVASCTNGGTVFTDNTVTLPTSITALGLGQPTYTTSVMLNGWIRRVSYFPRRLSNAELQSLTA